MIKLYTKLYTEIQNTSCYSKGQHSLRDLALRTTVPLSLFKPEEVKCYLKTKNPKPGILICIKVSETRDLRPILSHMPKTYQTSRSQNPTRSRLLNRVSYQILPSPLFLSRLVFFHSYHICYPRSFFLHLKRHAGRRKSNLSGTKCIIVEKKRVCQTPPQRTILFQRNYLM